MTPEISTLTFGCEFEVFFPTGTRFNPSQELFNRTGLRWDIHGDGSIRNNSGARDGVEFVSPVLRGQEGIDQVATVANALRDMGAQVNQSCGYHVHVGVNDDLTFFKNLVKLYAAYEPELDAVMPVSRRGNNAGFCRSLTNVNFAAIDQAASRHVLVREIARSAGSATDRYVKLNLAAFDRHRTVEFRQHSGTVDAVKAVNWIIRCLQMVKAAQEGRTGVETARQIARDYASFDRKTRICVELISRPQGVTTAELCAASGARKMGVKRFANLAGFTYRKRGKRYFLTSPTTQVVAAPTAVQTLDEVLKSSPEQRAFWQSRRDALARGRR